MSEYEKDGWAGVTVEDALKEQTRRLKAVRAAERATRVHYEDIRNYNKELEDYLCQCLSVFAQHDIAPPDPPDPPERVGRVLSEKFINAIKGE